MSRNMRTKKRTKMHTKRIRKRNTKKITRKNHKGSGIRKFLKKYSKKIYDRYGNQIKDYAKDKTKEIYDEYGDQITDYAKDQIKTYTKEGLKYAKKSYGKYKRDANYHKQIKADKKRVPYKPEDNYKNFETDAVERFSAFRTAMEDIQKDYPMLLEEYIWYSTLTGDEKTEVTKKYQKAGFDRKMWFGPPEEEIKTYKDGTYGHPSISWRCTLDGDKSFHLSIGYSLSLQWFLFNGEEQHWIPSRNACGPGTKVELRESKYWALLPLFINIIGVPMKGTYPWNKPINHTDQCCFKHDQEYSIRGQSSQQIQMADWGMLYCIKNGKKEDSNYEKLKDLLIKSTIQSKLAAEKIVNDGMYGTITERYDSNEDYPQTYEEFEKRTDELLGKVQKSKSKTSSMRLKPSSVKSSDVKSSVSSTTNLRSKKVHRSTLKNKKQKKKKVSFKSKEDIKMISESLNDYKNKSVLPVGINKNLSTVIPKKIYSKLEKTATKMGTTPASLLMTAAAATMGNTKDIIKLATQVTKLF